MVRSICMPRPPYRMTVFWRRLRTLFSVSVMIRRLRASVSLGFRLSHGVCLGSQPRLTDLDLLYGCAHLAGAIKDRSGLYNHFSCLDVPVDNCRRLEHKQLGDFNAALYFAFDVGILRYDVSFDLGSFAQGDL